MAHAQRVFLSYAFEEDDGHKEEVLNLAEKLKRDGVEVRIDEWHLAVGDSIAGFMAREIKNAEFVLALCSPAFRRKVHETEEEESVRGVGFEFGYALERLFSNRSLTVVPVLLSGGWDDASPDFLHGKKYVDLSSPGSYEEGYQMLLERIVGTEHDAQAETTLTFKLTELGDDSYEVSLREGDSEVTAPLELDLGRDSKHHGIIEMIEAGTANVDGMHNLGHELFAGLLSGELDESYQQARTRCRDQPGSILKIRIDAPASLQHVPWEALWDIDEDDVGVSPTASLVRTTAAFRPKKERDPSHLKMLVVIPTGSGLSTSSEWVKIDQIRRSSQQLRIERLDGLVTPGRLGAKLKEESWDIVHFIGHGKFDDQGQPLIHLNEEPNESHEEGDPQSDEASSGWIRGPLFANLFKLHPPALVVLNCCRGAGSATADSEGGAGPACALAAQLGRWVPAVVGMRYEVHDNVAGDFSGSFYRELISSDRPGRVDLAVQAARAVLALSYSTGERARSYITPALYLGDGCEHLFELEVQETTESRVSIVDSEISPKLTKALEDGCCLPIIGPGVLAAGAVRSDEVPPGPAGLAQLLAKKSGFQDVDRLFLPDTGSDWLAPVLLDRVCQHFEAWAPGERRDLYQEIKEIYEAFSPTPSLDRIASWKVPGLVYTHVDGLLEQSLAGAAAKRHTRLLVAQAESLITERPAPDSDVVLINLRGTYSVQESMVLTESDKELLLDHMERISLFVQDVINRSGPCSLLFLGVGPRDTLVRGLGRRLLRSEGMRNKATSFFVDSDASDADRTYWQQFEKLDWLDLDTAAVIETLTATVEGRQAQ